MALASVALDPAEVRFIVDQSREIHAALRNPKQRTNAEEPVHKFARSSIVADRDLAAGHILQEDDIWARRPGTGEIAGYELDAVIGQKLMRALDRNTQLSWSDLEKVEG